VAEQMAFDRTVAQQLEWVYSRRDVIRRRRLVRDALAPSAGDRILDAGCGPGFYVDELSEIVGADGSVVGIDASEDMLAVAAGRCEGRRNVTLKHGEVTAIPADDLTFDAAISIQVLEYVKDVGAALDELYRVLRPGGRLVVWDVDWSTVSWHSQDPERMERVLAAWDRHLADPVLPRRLAPLLRRADFDAVGCVGHAFASAEFTPEAYGGTLVGLVRQYVGDSGLIDEAELDAWAAEQHELGERGEFYFACVQCCFTARRPN
jgi:ubiquinone/menaquinone biosynthesis C-methylase UbiE